MNNTKPVELYLRKFTKKELLTFTYNEILQRIVNFTVDVEFFQRKAKRYKPESQETLDALKDSLESKESLALNKLSLMVIEEQLQKLENEEKK